MAIEIDLAVAMVSEYDADGFPGVGADFFGPNPGVAPGEQHHPLGVLARPRDPDVDSQGQPTLGATMLRMVEGNEEHALALGDPRATPKLPRNDKGGTVLYADTGAAVLPFARLSGADGTFQIYVPYGSPATAMTIALDVSTAGAESVQIVHGSGMRITMTAGGTNAVVVTNKAGDAYMAIDDAGITLNGNLQAIGGLAVGVPSPPGPPPPMPVARALELTTWATLVNVTLTQVAALLNAAGPVIGAPGAVTVPAPLASTVTAVHLSTT